MRKRIGALLASASGYAIGAALGTFYTAGGATGLTPAMAMLTAYSRTLTDEVAAYEAAYTGASHKTMTDQYGLLTFAPNNLLTYSNDFSNASWGFAISNPTRTSGVSDPDGGTDAWTLTATGANSLINHTFTSVVGDKYINSIWIRRRTGTGVITLRYPNYTDRDITGEISGTWTRIASAGTATGAISYFAIRIATSGDEIDIYQAQSERVTYETTPRAYNATTSAAYYGYRCVYAPETLQTSSTSITIGSGSSYTFAVADESLYAVGKVVQATDNANPDNLVRGYVISTASGSVTLGPYTFPGTAYSRPVLTNGSGTISDWSVLRSDGYLAEPAAASICTRSNDFSFSAPWSTDPTGQTVVANQVGPDGVTNSAWTLSDTDTGLRGRSVLAIVANDSTTYTVSCHFKKTTSAASFPGFGFYLQGGATVYAQVIVDTDNGVAIARTGFEPTSSHVEDIGLYWRVSVTKANNSTGNTSLNGVIYPAVATSAVGTWTGSVTGSAVVYGFQIETGSVATSYIPTAASSVSRAADVDSLSTTGWWTGSGTFVASAKTPCVGDLTIFKLSDGTANEVIDFYTSGTNPVLQITDGGATQLAPLDLGTAVADTFSRYAIRVAANDVNGAQDGTAATADTGVTLPTVTTLSIGEHGGLSELLYFASEEADSSLEALLA